MKTLSLSDAKARLSGLVEEVERRGKKIVIKRNGHPAAVLMSYREYISLKETRAIRVDHDLAREIRAGLDALKSREARLYTLEELLK